MYGQAVSLARYAERIGYRECAFFGVNHPDNADYACRTIWTQAQRTMVTDALAQAQGLIEDELRYPLCPRWITDERQFYRVPVQARWGHVISGGVVSDTVIQAGVAVVYTSDPATVTVNGVTCDVEDIHVYHAGTDEEIVPETITLVAGVLTLSIPWCRLVDPDYQDNPEDGLAYADVATWGAVTVDVHCITNDPSTQAKIVIDPSCLCTSAPCTETEYDACIRVRLPEIGSVEVSRADYESGAWVRKTLCYTPSFVELNYLAGLSSLPRQAEDAIIRLAHSLMPEEPCGCDVTQRLWRRDRNVPTVLTRERINCTFGLMDGAWFAWQWSQANKLRRGSVL